MIRTALLSTATALAASLAMAEADPRAIQSCAQADPSFVAIEKCLPDADVAVRMLDLIATDAFFGAGGADLAQRCIALNDEKHGLTGAWACASNAIKAAIRLGRQLPEGTTLDDPLFTALNRPTLQEPLETAEDAARDRHPDKSFWGGTMYRPLK
ncbi:hypothetical protein G5B38_14410 [Pseudohalocynthiibacter aestuariivivens]|nr:hypothetical protein [Pseudohalocynthiibacter aestuariivivens]QIE46618.1 hypothetical protein G5B38_14410 [Pseudohalocynthiibacter aestuariivivens]